MAAYTERLLEPWRRRVEELAGENGQLRADLRHAKEELAQRDATAEEVGRLKAELAQAQRLVAEFEAVTDELEREQDAAATEVARRPWWQFWRREAEVADRLPGAVAEPS
jgi:chromosome segregation ATPase